MNLILPGKKYTEVLFFFLLMLLMDYKKWQKITINSLKHNICWEKSNEDNDKDVTLADDNFD